MAKRQVKVKVDSEFDGRGFDKASRSAGTLDNKMKGLGKAVSAAGTALLVALPAGIAVAGKTLFTLGQDFASLDAQIQTATGATGKALSDLQGVARDVLQDVPESFETVGKAIGDYNTFLGASGVQLEALIEKTLAFGRVSGEIDTAQLSQVANIFDLSVSELSQAMEALFVVTQNYGIPADKLISQLQTFGPLFDNAGFTIEETATFMGQLEKAGVDFSRVAPAINAFFRNLAKDADGGTMSVEEMGQAFRDTLTELGNLEGSDALAKASEIFGAEGAQRFLSAIQSGIITPEHFGVEAVTGSIMEAAEATLTWQDRLNILKNDLKVTFEPLAVGVFETVSGLLADISGWLDTIALQVAGRDGSIDPAAAFDVPQLITAEQTLAAMANAERVNAWEDLKAAFGGFVDSVGDSFGEDGGLGMLLGFGDRLQVRTTLAFEMLESSWKSMTSLFKLDLVGWGDSLVDSTADFVDIMANFFGIENAREMFRSWYETAISWVGQFFENSMPGFRTLKNLISSIFGGETVSDELGRIAIEQTRRGGSAGRELASGVTNFTGGLALVGERGPELVNLPPGSDVFSNRQSRNMMGGTTVNVTVAGSVLSERGLTDAINDALRRGSGIGSGHEHRIA